MGLKHVIGKGVWAFVLCLTCFTTSWGGLSYAQESVVYVVPIEGVIDLGLAPFVQRALIEADSTEAKAVILDINTFGGCVDAAVLIRDALLESPVLTVAFVNKRAISAGALIRIIFPCPN